MPTEKRGDNLLATGVLMEAWSVEDEGKGICYNVFCYNIQPSIEIDYATLNTNTKRIQALRQLPGIYHK